MVKHFTGITLHTQNTKNSPVSSSITCRHHHRFAITVDSPSPSLCHHRRFTIRVYLSICYLQSQGYYLVDAGYTNGEGFLAPYRGQRYHLNDWQDGYQPTTPKELFNKRHSSARNVIERCFGILKARWAILTDRSYYPIKQKIRIIMACCLLHNYIRQEMSIDPIESDYAPDVGTRDLGHEDEDNITSVGTTNEWTTFRDNLAETMFESWSPTH